MTVSKNGVRKTERVIEGVGEDVSLHPKRGNFVLLDKGVALYGGKRYYLDGYAPQSAVKPEPVAEPERLPLGTRVVIKRGASLSDVWVGQTGTLVERPGAVTAPYDYFAPSISATAGAFPLALYADEVEVKVTPEPTTVYFDEPGALPPTSEPSPRYQPGDRIRVLSTDTYGEEVPAGTVGTVVRDLGKGVFPVDVQFDAPKDVDHPFEYDEIEPYTEPAPFAVGDRVVYTVPDTFMGEPGSRWADRGLVGELGTVTEAPREGGVTVRWDNQGTLRNSIEFVQRAPEYREVTYKSFYDGPYRHYGLQRTSDGKISCTTHREEFGGLTDFRAEAPLDKAATRPFIITGHGMDVRPL